MRGFHQAVLDCHAQFGGDLEDMQRRYDEYDLKAQEEIESGTHFRAAARRPALESAAATRTATTEGKSNV